MTRIEPSAKYSKSYKTQAAAAKAIEKILFPGDRYIIAANGSRFSPIVLSRSPDLIIYAHHGFMVTR
jgi:hypothetical protein